jgi:hypothetical protein
MLRIKPSGSIGRVTLELERAHRKFFIVELVRRGVHVDDGPNNLAMPYQSSKEP